MAVALASVPALIRANDEQIGAELLRGELADSKLAELLYACEKNRYYRIFGYRSVRAYLAERWQDTPMAAVAGIKVRSLQRLLREYRIAEEIPLFRANFDVLSRTARRLLSQVITPETAEYWIQKGLETPGKDLAEMVRKTPAAKAPNRETRLSMTLPQSIRDLWEETKATARRLEQEEGGEPDALSEAVILERVCAEFLATYGAVKEATMACICGHTEEEHPGGKECTEQVEGEPCRCVMYEAEPEKEAEAQAP